MTRALSKISRDRMRSTLVRSSFIDTSLLLLYKLYSATMSSLDVGRTLGVTVAGAADSEKYEAGGEHANDGTGRHLARSRSSTREVYTGRRRRRRATRPLGVPALRRAPAGRDRSRAPRRPLPDPARRARAGLVPRSRRRI